MTPRPTSAAAAERVVDVERLLATVEAEPGGVVAKLLDAAVREFSAGGLSNARTQAIAQRAGVAIGTLHFHFKDKKTLYQVACAMASRAYREMLRVALVDEDSAPGAGSPIASFVSRSAAFLAQRPELARLLLFRFLTREDVGDSAQHLADMRVMQAALGARFATAGAGAVDVQLLILLAYFGSLAIFSASDVQEQFLGMAPTDPAFVERFGRFMHGLLDTQLA
jgi:AcrR family transcriptional regulator